LFEGHFDAAMAEAEKSLEFNPTFAQGLTIAGWVYAEGGMLEEAIAVQQKAAETAAWKWPLGRTYALMGREVEARAIATELETDPGPMDQWGLSVICAALGDQDNALRWLGAAYRSRFSWMPWNSVFAVPSQDLFAGVRDDHRFQDLVRRVGFPSIAPV
jgi:tetratricopeptide (TPR) repeat protein